MSGGFLPKSKFIHSMETQFYKLVVAQVGGQTEAVALLSHYSPCEPLGPPAIRPKPVIWYWWDLKLAVGEAFASASCLPCCLGNPARLQIQTCQFPALFNPLFWVPIKILASSPGGTCAPRCEPCPTCLLGVGREREHVLTFTWIVHMKYAIFFFFFTESNMGKYVHPMHFAFSVLSNIYIRCHHWVEKEEDVGCWMSKCLKWTPEYLHFLLYSI